MEQDTVSKGVSFKELADVIASIQVSPFIHKIDIELQQAILAGDRERCIVLLEEIARDVSSIEFFDYCVKSVRSLTKRHGKSININDVPLTKLAEVARDGVAFGDFFMRELSINEVLAYLSGCCGQLDAYSVVYAKIISALLAKDIESLGLQVSDFQNAVILVGNIITFRTWFFDRVIEGGLDPFLRVLPAFIHEDAEQLGVALGRFYSSNMKTLVADRDALLGILEGIQNKPRYQRYRDTILRFSRLARRTVFLEDTDYVPFERNVAKVAIVEMRDSPFVLNTTFSYIDLCFYDQYKQIHAFFAMNRRVIIDPQESIYLRRIGIRNIIFDIVDYERMKHGIRVGLELNDGFYFEFIVYDPKERPDEWLVVLADRMRVSDARVYEFMIYIQCLLLDILRYRDCLARGTSKSEADTARRLTKTLNQTVTIKINSLDITRRLLQGKIAKSLETQEVRMREFTPFYNGRRVYFSRYLDMINPLTGEVSRGDGFFQYYLPITLVDSNEHLRKINDLDQYTDWESAFIAISDISSIAACEYVLLQRL